MKTIAFITRVHPLRPKMLKVCIGSIKAQTSNEYIHILSRDDKTKKGYGVTEANRSLIKIKSINARYVMILDDDDMLVDLDFVNVFSKIVRDNKPEIVFFKGIVEGKGIYPREKIWGKTVAYAAIASFCFAVRGDIWKKYIFEFGKPKSAGLGGDYNFLSVCFKNTKNHVWLDRIVAKTQKKVGWGKGEGEHA